MISLINDIFDIMLMYINFLFGLEILPGVSVGSFFLVSVLLFVLARFLWPD